ncbi:MAG: class II fructose-bisphosphate aldolase [Anaerolineae bacterium]|jgi:fructose-bisphosphate aldolase class II|nr:class II fructose-bisphosphate aldolase [Anaerolineae bacterium]
MPLVSILDELKKAQAGGYALPCFDTFEMHGTMGIFDALEAKRAPAMIGLWSGMFDRPHPRAFADYVRAMAEEATVPVSIILDHGASFEHCIKALDAGFSDVMYDGSKLPFEENVANTVLVVRAAHAVGAAVEAELGHVGTGRTYQEFGAQGKGFTEPDTVVRFVEETGVDFLAVAVGTAHGLYDGEPKLALDLLAEIRERVDIPLVLHGGSGLADEQFRAAIAAGIQKVNIFTNLAVGATQRLLQHAKEENASVFSMTGQVRQAFCGECERLLDVFGSTGKA